MDRQTARLKAQALVDRMTVSEAASQLRYDAPAIDRLGIPAYNWWNEALHGVARAGTATSYPQAIALAAMFDPELVEKLGDVSATEGRAHYNAFSAEGDRDIYKGLTFWSPNVNIFRDPRWGRGHETYGEDPYLTSELGCAYVRGLQGNGETMKSAACAKHFAVHSGPEALRHHFNAIANEKDMAETYLPAFEALVKKAGVEAVMGAYNRTNGEPCCGSEQLLVKTLREKWGFEGHIVSDCWAVRDFHTEHKVTADAAESAALALNNGCDVNCGCTYQSAMLAYERGILDESVIRASAVRLFTARYMLGIMEGSEYDSIPFAKIECPEHLQIADEASHKCCVLLKNNGMLPMKKEALRTLAVVGPNADSRKALIGNYHGTSSRYITVSEALQDELGDDVRILYSEGCDLFRDRCENLAQPNDRISEAVSCAKNADAVVMVVGLDETLEGEEGDTGNAAASGDKLDLLLPESQRILMDAVLAVGKPTVIVLMCGSSIDLGTAAERADAILLSWYPGARGGRAVADILLGKTSPSGKLPVTFYKNEQLIQMPDFTDYSMKGRTYRYLKTEPLYPFGYGLTYGDVVPCNAKVEQTEDGNVEVQIEFENTGKMDTEDVAQVYVQNEGSINAPDNARLAGFKRFCIRKGEKTAVKLQVLKEQLKVFNDNGESIDEGSIVFYVGNGQRDSRTAALTGHEMLRITL